MDFYRVLLHLSELDEKISYGNKINKRFFSAKLDKKIPTGFIEVDNRIIKAYFCKHISDGVHIESVTKIKAYFKVVKIDGELIYAIFPK